MLRLKHKLRSFTYNLPIAKMRKEYRLFICAHFAFHAALSMTSIFVSAFLFNVSGKMSTIAIYHLFFYFMEMLGIYCVVRFSDKLNNVIFSTIGLVLHAIAYGALLLTREGAIHIYPLIASICGLGSGFYWVSYYTLLQVYTSPHNRQFGIAFISLIQSVISLSAPLVSGFILSKVIGTVGYIIIFSIALVFFAISVFVELRLRGTVSENKSKKLFPMIKKMWHKKALNCEMLGEFIAGLRGGVYAFYLSILIYSMTSDELILGFSNTVSGAVSILIAYFLSRVNFGEKGRGIMLITALSAGLMITGSLFFWYGALAVIVYFVLNNATEAIANHFKTYMGYEVSEYASRVCETDCAVEHSAVKLIALEIGRLCGIGVSFLIPGENVTWILIFFVILTVLNLISGFVYEKAAKMCRN